MMELMQQAADGKKCWLPKVTHVNRSASYALFIQRPGASPGRFRWQFVLNLSCIPRNLNALEDATCPVYPAVGLGWPVTTGRGLECGGGVLKLLAKSRNCAVNNFLP
jgi:hypothetical protein